MGVINLTGLEPGKSYNVVVRAKNDSGIISENSPFYTFTVPSINPDGTQLTSINSAVVTSLAPDSSSAVGGALIAGGLDEYGAAQAGAINLGEVWNNTASSLAKLTGTANTGAVIINSTGILGYQLTSASSGQANFFLDTASGNAYFRGTVYASAGEIGGFKINNSSLSASTFFNKLTSFDPSFEDQWLNYWTASADYFGNLDMGLSLINDASITPQAGLKYAKFSVDAFGNSSPYISGSSIEMTMFRTASSKTAFSQSDLGISSGSTYTLSVYAQDLGSNNYGTPLPAKIFLKINKYNSASTSSATFTGSAVSSVVTTSSTAWTRISASFNTSASEYYTFSIINAEDYEATPPGFARYVYSIFAVDAIQLELGNTAQTFGFDNYFAVSPADSKPINLSSIANTGSTSNIFSVYTDGGVYANYFFSNKQSKIGSVYFGGRKSSNISIGDYFATNQDNTNGNNINIGNGSLGVHVSGSNNIAIGYNAAGYVGYGSNNVVIGGYTGELYWSNGNVIIADGAGNVRIKANSSGLVTIPGSASVSGSVYAGTIVGSIASATYASSAVYASSAIYSSSSNYSSSAGYLPASGLSASTITIGSTSIGLGNTSTSILGLNNVDITSTTGSTVIFSASSNVSNETGGAITLRTAAAAAGTGATATGGAINITTTANQTGATAGATGGGITISTTGTAPGAGGANGGNISISTNRSGTYGVAGAINITSNGNFTISTVAGTGGYVGTINNFNIGTTTPGTGTFTTGSFTGKVTAASFSGDGSGLTNLPAPAMQVLTSATTSTTGSTLYPVFPAASQNITLKANTVYYFEGFYAITKQASTNSGNWTVAFSFSNPYQSLYWNGTFTSNNATAATLSGAINTSASSSGLGTAGTGTSTGLIKFQGFFQTNATTGGTLQPQFGQSVTPTSGNPSVNAGSYFRLIEQGTAYPVISGSWGP